MENFESVFEEDLGLDAPVEEGLEPVIKEETIDSIFGGSTAEPSIVDDLLKAKGIQGSKILIIDEENNEQEVDFYSLSKAEQLEILATPEPETAPSTLQQDEEELISYLRDNKITLQEYLQLYEQSVVEKLNENNEPTYDIDAYDDEELFLLDLKSRYDDLTDEELIKELEKELENKELFLKKTTKLRSEYKQLEDTYKEEQQKEFNAQRETQYNGFVDTMVDVAVKTQDLYGIELEDDEKNNVLSTLLELDDNGTSQFNKLLEDPDNLYRAAWFLAYGEQAFNAIKDAYEAEIAKLKKDKPQVIIKKTNPIKDIDDLFN